MSKPPSFSSGPLDVRNESDGRPPSDADLQSLAAPEIYALLGSSARGLSHAEAAQRLVRHGKNVLRETPGPSILLVFAANFTHLMAILLWVGGAVAFLAKAPRLGVAVWLVNVINGLFSFWQEYKAEKAIEALRVMIPLHAVVVRAGEQRRIPAEDLVPGDLMVLAEGDRICADARLVEAAGLRVEQAALTGESRPVRKTAEASPPEEASRRKDLNVALAGTSVVSGDGRAVVFATGMNTAFGRIAHLTQSLGKGKSPLQKEIDSLTRRVAALAVGVGLFFFPLALFFAGMDPAQGFIYSLGMIAAFVPEGLLPTVTLSLAMGIRRMAARNALVKRLSAVDALGCATVICTDKTGTLTKNEMTVRELWLPDRSLTVTGVGYGREGRVLEGGRPADISRDRDLADLISVFALCNNARIEASGESAPGPRPIGDPTEAALLVLAAKADLDPGDSERYGRRLFEIPFDSRRRRMSMAHVHDGRAVLRLKGAPAETLRACRSMRRRGRDEPLDPAGRAAIQEAADALAQRGFRVLASASRNLSPNADPSRPRHLERDMTFLGLAAIMDPPRPETAEAVARCHRAGIRVVMLTGDHPLTAVSVAAMLGIVRDPAARALTGDELTAMSDAEVKEILQGEAVFARAAPEHKLRVVGLLKDMGHVAAVTGDGVNDAPALKKADIGVAMGLTGTEVAKEAADMILADDNFASIVSAIEEGRAVFENIKKFTTYIFTSNTAEAAPFILYALSGGRIPLALTIMQILAVDLGANMVPCLALGAEPPEPGIMDKPPRKRTEHVVSGRLLAKAYLWLGPILALAAMAAFYRFYWTRGYCGQWLDLPGQGEIYRTATAVTLAAVVAGQVGNLFAQRSAERSVFALGLGANRLALVGALSELAILGLIVSAPPLQDIFDTAPLQAGDWLAPLCLIPLLLALEELRKAVLGWRRRRKGRPAGLPPDATP